MDFINNQDLLKKLRNSAATPQNKNGKTNLEKSNEEKPKTIFDTQNNNSKKDDSLYGNTISFSNTAKDDTLTLDEGKNTNSVLSTILKNLRIQTNNPQKDSSTNKSNTPAVTNNENQKNNKETLKSKDNTASSLQNILNNISKNSKNSGTSELKSTTPKTPETSVIEDKPSTSTVQTEPTTPTKPQTPKTPTVTKQSQVFNLYYIGTPYTINKSGHIVTVINKKSKEETVIDLDVLCKDLPYNMKAQFMVYFMAIPAEVMVDIAKEVSLREGNYNGDTQRSYYSGSRDIIALASELMPDTKENVVDTITHETGHALDYLSNGYSTTATNKDYMKCYKWELLAFLLDGNTQFSEEWDPVSGTTKVQGESKDYATKNEREMFAECYTLLMTGDCTSKECITKYFPMTLKAAKEHMNYIRSLSDSERHSA